MNSVNYHPIDLTGIDCHMEQKRFAQKNYERSLFQSNGMFLLLLLLIVLVLIVLAQFQCLKIS